MKKYLFLLCLLFIAVSSQAENKFTVDNIEIKPGEELTVSVGLTNEEDAKSASIDIFLPECLTFVGENGTVVFSSRADGISMKSAKIQTNGALRVGFAIGSIPAGNGELFTFKLKAKDDAASGSYKIQYKTMALTYTSKVNLPDMESAVVVYRNFTISANSSNDEMGTVEGAGEYKENTSATLTATPIEGYHFVKWSDETTVNPYTFTVTGEVSLTATFAPNQYTITFDSKGGTPVADVTADYKAAITAPAAPTREGYTFAGWDPAFPETMPLNGAALTAKWTAITYTLTYDLAGGSVATANPANYTIESAAITLTNPTREGYTFAGWTGTGLSGATQTVTIAQGSIGNRSYTATWTPITYTLTYDLAGGTLATANPSEYTIESAAITLANPTREGYTFAGWTGTGLSGATQTVTIANGSTGNRSYVATWTPITYTLTYDLAGGAVATANPTEYNIESAAITLTNPTREGYNFAGWTGTGLDGVTMTVTIAKGSMGNRSYTATWTPITYTLTYDLAGGTLATANPSEYTIESAAITLANPTREGYTFAGWTGTGLSGATQTVTIANGSTGNRSYVATWTPITYTLTYDLAGGTLATVNPASYTIESENITLINPTREGYTFAGWTGTGLSGATQTVTIAKGSTGNRSYTATWTINQYSMTFVFGNGQENQVITQDYGTTLTAPTPNEWTGHTFKGWNPEVPATIPAEDKTFTAQWDVNKYKLTFMVDDQVYSQTDVEYDAAIVVPENPTKEGYTFTSWDAAIPEKMPANDLTFNAQFTINQYTMTFVFGNGQENQVITQDYGTTLTAPTPNEWTGHTFKGWNPEVPATIPAEDKTFTAQWDVNKYKLTFMVDDQVYSQTDVEYDAAIVVPENPTKEGYTFTSWDAAIPEKMPAEDLTFNAQFTINQYYVIYIVKEQEWARDQFNYGETIVLRDAPTLEPGEIFVRWDSDEDYVTMPAHDITYTAVIDLPNGIVQVFQDKETAAVYTITGVLIDKNMSVSEVMKLAKGLYIVNGHKIYIK